jgi:hypothetical protein
VPVSDEYVLVGHYGEATGIVPQWLNKGELFPLLGVSAEAGPLWYVRLFVAAELTNVA